jgi:hypothetical protein
MDNRRFDALARAVGGKGTSRRGALKALVAAAVGGVLAGRSRGASAQCEPLGSECTTGAECCSGGCVDGTCCRRNGAACAANGVCCSGNCSSGKCCPAGKTNCNGACVNLKTDANNCNECGRVCLSGRTCCNGFCVNTQTSETNCGECGKRCPTGQTCQDGDCCRPLRTTCTSYKQCCQSGGPTTCAAYATCGSTTSGTRCCRPAGGPCSDNCDCCGDNLCRNGSCGAPRTAPDAGPRPAGTA